MADLGAHDTPTPAGTGVGAAVRVSGIEKRFGAVRANDGIDAEFRPGDVHGLLGENGAGKSTLVKILSGIHQPDAGAIEIGGRQVTVDSPTASRELGIAVVHQQSTLVPALTVLENAALIEGGLGRIDDSLAGRLVQSARNLGFEIDPKARVDDLTVGQRQRVEIARALMHDARVVLLDEPTAVLAPSERADLFALLGRIKAHGTGVVLVTHRLEEAIEHCDRLTVLRGGRVVGNSDRPSELSEAELVRMLVGEVATYHRTPRPAGDLVLRAQDVAGLHSPHAHPLRGVTLEVRAGEVVGMAGVEGNGQRELALALVGAWRPDEGSVRLRDRQISEYASGERARLVADIPDDDGVAVVPQLPIWQNMALAELAWRKGPTPRARARHRRRAEELVREFGVRAPDVETPVGWLSGGNRRRVVLARELSKQPALVVAGYATKGLDVRSQEQVKQWIGRLAGQGAAVVYIASELEELLEVSDRIAVLARGRITGEMPASGADVQEIGRLMLADVSAEKERA